MPIIADHDAMRVQLERQQATIALLCASVEALRERLEAIAKAVAEAVAESIIR